MFPTQINGVLRRTLLKYVDVLSLFGYAGVTIVLPGILYIFPTSFQLSSDYFMKLGDNVCEIKSTFLH